MRMKSSEGLIADDPAYLTFHLWLLIAVASGFALFITIQTGGLSFVIENDSTFISSAIMIFFLSSSLFCGRRAFRLSRELIAVQYHAKQHPAFAENLNLHLPKDAEQICEATWSGQVLSKRDSSKEERETTIQALEEKILGPHDVGWFITESLTKLGLLGTVIGFLIMLTALIGSNQLELSAMQMILRDMASGMGIKIIATVVGLLCNMILALEWLLLDRCAQKILSGVRLQLGTRNLEVITNTAGSTSPKSELAPAQ
jgi:MotA/TolQ/ExbB proton channel family